MKMISSQLQFLFTKKEIQFVTLDNYDKTYNLICGTRNTLYIVSGIKSNDFVCIKEFRVVFSFRD